MMQLIGAGLTALGLLFTIVGTAVPSWAIQENDELPDQPLTMGLNSFCATANGDNAEESECVTYSDFYADYDVEIGGWVKQSMAFAIMAILALGTATMAMAGHTVMKKDKLKIPAVGAAGFGIFCQLVAIAIFAGNFDTEDDPETPDVVEGFADSNENDFTAGPAMILMIFAMLVNVAGVGVYFVMGSMNPFSKGVVQPQMTVVQQPQMVVQQQPQMVVQQQPQMVVQQQPQMVVQQQPQMIVVQQGV